MTSLSSIKRRSVRSRWSFFFLVAGAPLFALGGEIDARHYFTISIGEAGHERFLTAGDEADGVQVGLSALDAEHFIRNKWQFLRLPDGSYKLSPAQFDNQLSLDVRNDGGRNDGLILDPTARLFGQKWSVECDPKRAECPSGSAASNAGPSLADFCTG